MRFKPGDKIKCINDDLGFLELNKIYTIKSVVNPEDYLLVSEQCQRIQLIEDIKSLWLFKSNRFILADEFKIEKEEDYYKWLNLRLKN